MRFFTRILRRGVWRKLFFFLGLSLFAFLVYQFNPKVLWQNLTRVGFNYVFILGIGFLWYFVYTLAWYIFLKYIRANVNLRQAFTIKVAGETVNSLTPLSWGGGDPARIWLLSKIIPFRESAASVVVDRTLNNLALALFMLLGLIISFFQLTLSPAYQLGLAFLIGIIMAISIFLYLRSHEGLLEFFIDLLKKLRIKKSFSQSTLEHATTIDRHIANFYKGDKRDFFAALGLHFFGRLCGVLEIWLAALFLDHPLGFLDSYLLASLAIIVNILFAFIPGALGVMEGAFAGSFALFHLDPAVGASIQVIRRIRILFWGGVGWIFLIPYRRAYAGEIVPEKKIEQFNL